MLLPNDFEHINELAEFHKAVLFCNAVVQVAHRTIVSHIIRYFYDGFLLEVFKPSVLEVFLIKTNFYKEFKGGFKRFNLKYSLFSYVFGNCNRRSIDYGSFESFNCR